LHLLHWEPTANNFANIYTFYFAIARQFVIICKFVFVEMIVIWLSMREKKIYFSPFMQPLLKKIMVSLFRARITESTTSPFLAEASSLSLVRPCPVFSIQMRQHPPVGEFTDSPHCSHFSQRHRRTEKPNICFSESFALF